MEYDAEQYRDLLLDVFDGLEPDIEDRENSVSANVALSLDGFDEGFYSYVRINDNGFISIMSEYGNAVPEKSLELFDAMNAFNDETILIRAYVDEDNRVVFGYTGYSSDIDDAYNNINGFFDILADDETRPYLEKILSFATVVDDDEE